LTYQADKHKGLIEIRYILVLLACLKLPERLTKGEIADRIKKKVFPA
jgi:hypothetical protein